MDFKERCFVVREGLKPFEEKIKDLKRNVEVPREGDPGEMFADVMLALRHLEDCRMRLGKAIQAYDGVVSVYPR